MRETKLEIHLIAETSINTAGLASMLIGIGATSWWPEAVSDGEDLIEVAGRLCYKSFEVGMNANITKVREGNQKYLENILTSKHGSVLEHSSVSFALLNVSRIFTHELVRHRAGTAFSQESMRFVRMDDIPIRIPDLTEDFEELAGYQDIEDQSPMNWAMRRNEDLAGEFEQITRDTEKVIGEHAKMLDRPGVPFDLKKRITSALRRLAPGGHTTNIIVTANHRAWRHMIEMRTSSGAEEEIKYVFTEIACILKGRYPNVYQDMDPQSGGYVFKHSKV